MIHLAMFKSFFCELLLIAACFNCVCTRPGDSLRAMLNSEQPTIDDRAKMDTEVNLTSYLGSLLDVI